VRLVGYEKEKCSAILFHVLLGCSSLYIWVNTKPVHQFVTFTLKTKSVRSVETLINVCTATRPSFHRRHSTSVHQFICCYAISCRVFHLYSSVLFNEWPHDGEYAYGRVLHFERTLC